MSEDFRAEFVDSVLAFRPVKNNFKCTVVDVGSPLVATDLTCWF